MSKTNLFAEKCIPCDTSYIKFQICQTKLCMKTLYSKNIQIFMGIKITKSSTIVTFGEEERQTGEEGLHNFSILSLKNIFEESLTKC